MCHYLGAFLCDLHPLLRVSSTEKEPLVCRDLAVFRPLCRAFLQVSLRVLDYERGRDPLVFSLCWQSVNACLFTEEHDSSLLLFHLLDKAGDLNDWNLRADPRNDIIIEALVDPLHLDQVLQTEVFKHYLYSCALPKIALILIVMRWQLNRVYYLCLITLRGHHCVLIWAISFSWLSLFV